MASANGKEMELPDALKLTNVMLAGGHPFINPLSMFCVVQYKVNCFRAAKRKTLSPTRKISITNYLIGESCAHIEQRLAKYSVSSTMWSIGPFAIENNDVILYYEMLVPAGQAWMADVILRWFQGPYLVTSAPIYDSKRGSSMEYAQRYPTPWQPKGSPPKSRGLDMFISNALFGWIYGRSRFSKAMQEEIDRKRAEAGKPTSKQPAPAKAQQTRRKPAKRKKSSKLMKFLSS